MIRKICFNKSDRPSRVIMITLTELGYRTGYYIYFLLHHCDNTLHKIVQMS